MSQDVADISANLRSAMRQEGTSTADAVEASTVQPDSTQEPASEPTPDAPPAETPVEAAPEPSDAPAEPEPQADEPFDLAEAIKSTGIDTSKYASPQEALPHVLKQLRQKVDEQGKKLKGFEAQPAAAPQPPPVQASPTPAPPATAMQTVGEAVEAEVKQRLTANPQVTQALHAYKANSERLSNISQKELPDIQREVTRLEAYLPENAKAMGLPEPDEVTAADIRNRIAILQSKHERLSVEAMRLDFANERIRSGYSQLEAQYRYEANGRYQEELYRAEEDERVNTEADAFVNNWKATFESVMTKNGIADEEQRARIWNGASDLARLDPSQIGADLSAYIERFTKAELAYADKLRRDAARVNAERKKADVKPQAPTGTAAVAPPKPNAGDKSDPFASLLAANRARAQSGAAS